MLPGLVDGEEQSFVRPAASGESVMSDVLEYCVRRVGNFVEGARVRQLHDQRCWGRIGFGESEGLHLGVGKVDVTLQEALAVLEATRLGVADTLGLGVSWDVSGNEVWTILT